jgi:hypothetical protein
MYQQIKLTAEEEKKVIRGWLDEARKNEGT